MFKQIAPWLISATLVIGLPGFAAAEMMTPEQARISLAKAKRREQRMARIRAYRKRFQRQTTRPGTKVVHVPELDPGAANGALVLLLGGVLVITGRRRRRQPVPPDAC